MNIEIIKLIVADAKEYTDNDGLNSLRNRWTSEQLMFAINYLSTPAAQPAPGWITPKQFENIVRDICELPDYSSPEDQPEVFMCTTEELRCILVNNEVMEDVAAPPAPHKEGE